MSEQTKPTLGVVILTRGDTALLEGCLDSLPGALAPFHATVAVVEHETDQARDVVHAKMPDASYLRMTDTPEQKQSFSSLNNAGAGIAQGDYLLLLNNDIILNDATIHEMYRAMEEKPDVGVVGAKLLFADGTIQHIGVVFTPFGVPEHFAYGKPDDGTFPPADRSDYFDAVTFACVLIRRSVWDLVGGLDPAYHFNFEDVDFCIKARMEKWRSYVTMTAVAYHLESQSMEFRNTADNSIVRNFKIFRDKWIFSGKLQEVVGLQIQRESGPLHDDRPNIAFLPAGQHVGISFWRMDQVCRWLAEKHLANVKTVYATQSEAMVIKTMQKADLGIWQSHSNEGVRRLAAMGEDRSFRMIYEYDDHPIYIPPFAQAYRTFGCQEVSMKAKDGSEAWIWRDGENGFDVERNRKNREIQLEIISRCDAVTTTTRPLAEYFKTINPRVFQLPNCIDFDLYRPLGDFMTRKAGPIRIGWWGGDNHWHDISAIGPAIVDYVNNHDVKLVLMGAFYKGPLRGIDLNKVEEHPWVHVEAFPWRLAAACLDIVLVPLANPVLPGLAFNKFKSGLKWYEASALKIPSLVQGGVAPYEEAIHGTTAMTFLTDEEFKENLDALCNDSVLRARIAQGAHDWVREYRDISKEIFRWSEAYRDVLKGHFEYLDKPESAAVAEGS